ncbi:hypothetical protein ABK040_003267 [Willaertia magna]
MSDISLFKSSSKKKASSSTPKKSEINKTITPKSSKIDNKKEEGLSSANKLKSLLLKKKQQSIHSDTATITPKELNNKPSKILENYKEDEEEENNNTINKTINFENNDNDDDDLFDEQEKIFSHDLKASTTSIITSDDDEDDDYDDLNETDLKNKKTKSTEIVNSYSSNKTTFESLGVDPWLVKHLSKLHIHFPTLIQEKCIPPTLAGKNIIGMSQTGSGKTAAFALPIIQNLAKDMFGIYALIITPTRELAIQIQEHFRVLAGDLPLRVTVLVGGLNFMKQAELLDSSPHIVIGTPSRVEDMLRKFSTEKYFKKIRYLVFDEADTLFSLEKSLDLQVILNTVNPNRQTLLYSATMNNEVKRLAKIALNQSGKTKKEKEEKLYIYDACKLFTIADNLQQYYLFMPKNIKDSYFIQLLKTIPDGTISVVFFSNVYDCELLAKTCQLMGINCASLHAAKGQYDRVRVLKDFKKRVIKFLFSTDVSSRGIDIPAVSYVINYELPDTTDIYVHRVGRTARAGRLGISISLVSQYEVKRVKAIEADTKVYLRKYDDFNEEEAEKETFLLEIAENKCKAKIELIDSDFYEMLEGVKQKKENTNTLKKQAKLFYEMRLMEELKQSSKLKGRFSGKNDNVEEEGFSENSGVTLKGITTTKEEDDEENMKKRKSIVEKEIGGISLIKKKSKTQ